jgi:hypothetical protein
VTAKGAGGGPLAQPASGRDADCQALFIERRLMTKILPVIMCGGSGTRVWPESRETLPSQFIPLIGERSTFQTTMQMLDDPAFKRPIVISSVDYRFLIADQLREIGAQADIVLEPCAAIRVPPSRSRRVSRGVGRRRPSSSCSRPTTSCAISPGSSISARRRPRRPRKAISSRLA